MRGRLASLPEAQRRSLSAEIEGHLASIDLLDENARTALYVPLAGEVDIAALLAARWQRDLPVWLPRMREDGALDFVAVRDPSQLRTARHGIRQPRAELAATPLPELEAVVLPGLAFDEVGVRLGRGGGYYDRSLASHPPGRPHRIGVAFAFQILEALPRAPHDLRVDTLITEHGARDPR